MSKDDFWKQFLGFSDIDEENEDLEAILAGMTWEEVSSSNLAGVGYRKKGRKLAIAFLDGSIYVYDGVPVEIYDALMAAPSHGTYFYWNIRQEYAYERVAG